MRGKQIIGHRWMHKHFRGHGYRITTARKAILALFADSDMHLSAMVSRNAIGGHNMKRNYGIGGKGSRINLGMRQHRSYPQAGICDGSRGGAGRGRCSRHWFFATGLPGWQRSQTPEALQDFPAAFRSRGTELNTLKELAEQIKIYLGTILEHITKLKDSSQNK